MQHQILWIEGRRVKTPPFASELKEKGYQVVSVATGKAALNQATGCVPAVTVLNAASMDTSGARILDSLRDVLGSRPILVIQNDHGGAHALPADQILQLPFTIRKLENRLRQLLPDEKSQLLKAGKITLDLTGQTVQVSRGKRIHITQLAASLLQELMVHAGDVVPRKKLFCRVWQTDYTGDTRTLDVHISWLRKAIEKDPKKPRYIRTIRRVGYRLDV